MSLPLTELGGVAAAEEAGGELDEPLGVDERALPHVLLCGHHQLVVDEPIGLALE